MAADEVLTPMEHRFVAAARTALLATMGADGRPKVVPICFVMAGTDAAVRIYSPLDEKPKRVADPHDLQRVRNIVANPEVSLLVDHWSEDWSELGWVRLEGRAQLVEPGEAATSPEHRTAVAALRAKYPQYAAHLLEDRPIIRIAIERSRSWGNLEPAA